MNSGVLGSYHPAVGFSFFMLMLLLNLTLNDPVFLIISIAAAFGYSLLLKGRKAIKFLAFAVPVFLFIALINPLFSHRGFTVLFELFGNPITLESVAYGVSAGLMYVGILIWFTCYSALITTDRFTYLFGRVLPAISLLITMTMRLIPRMAQRARLIADAQRTAGADMGAGSLSGRARHGANITSILISWTLENSVETADSMKARGYGLKGRTSYMRYALCPRDTLALAVFTGVAALLIVLYSGGTANFVYYPELLPSAKDALYYIAAALYALICFAPLLMEGAEVLKWRYLLSKNLDAPSRY